MFESEKRAMMGHYSKNIKKAKNQKLYQALLNLKSCTQLRHKVLTTYYEYLMSMLNIRDYIYYQAQLRRDKKLQTELTDREYDCIL